MTMACSLSISSCSRTGVLRPEEGWEGRSGKAGLSWAFRWGLQALPGTVPEPPHHPSPQIHRKVGGGWTPVDTLHFGAVEAHAPFQALLSFYFIFFF